MAYIVTNGVWFYSQTAADPIHQIGPWTKHRDAADVLTQADADKVCAAWKQRVRNLRVVAAVSPSRLPRLE